MKPLILSLFLVGCDVAIDERVIYEDGTPVVDVEVIHSMDRFEGITRTDNNGRWSIRLPADSYVWLCIENPLNDFELSCYNGLLKTPAIDSGLNTLIKENE